MRGDPIRGVRLEVERPADPGELINLVQNPSGELGAWGWVTPVDGSVLRSVRTGGGYRLLYTSPGGAVSEVQTEDLPVAPGQWLGLTWVAPAVTGRYAVRVQWVAANGAPLAATAFSAPYAGSGTRRTLAAVQAPSGAAYARPTFRHYANDAGANPAAGTTLSLTDVAATATATAGGLGYHRTNLLTAPSAESTPLTGWTAQGGSVTSSTAAAYVGTRSIAAVRGNDAGTLVVLSELVPATGGRDHALQVRTRPRSQERTPTLSARWEDADGRVVATQALGAVTETRGTWTAPLSGVATAPFSATGVRLMVDFGTVDPGETHYLDAALVERSSNVGTYFDGSTPTHDGVTYAWTGSPHASTSTETGAPGDLGALVPTPFVNIMGPTHEITVTREGINVGTLAATVLDSNLDPSRHEVIRPGRRVRMLDPDGEVLFTGKALTASVAYKPLERQESKRTEITLNAVDGVNLLAAAPRAEGVATIAELPYVLEGAGVPWSINGSGDQVPTAEVVAYNESASAVDQVVVTRDSAFGLAWVDRNGVLQAWDRDLLPAVVAAELDETTYDSDIEVGFDTANLINSVTVNLLQIIATSGATEEVPYGPYLDEDSVAEWGTFPAEYSIQGEFTEAQIATYAARVLAANAAPAVRVTSLSLRIRAATAALALLDLYDLVRVTNTRADVDELSRITSLTHTLTANARGGSWRLALGFAADGVAAPSQSTSAPPPNVGAVKEELEVQLVELTDGLQDAYDRADAAAAEAEEAAKSATTAQQAANGKNKVTYSVNGPGATPNNPGDIWFQKDAPTQTIIGQWEGLGGTSWSAKTIRSEVIANLDAGKLTAGSAFTNALTVKTNFTLGDATTDGVIQSYNFAQQSTGVFINKNGLVAKGGSIAGAAIIGGTVTGALLRTAESSTRVEVSHGGNPFQSNQTWGLVEFYNSNPSWAPGRIWGTYDSNANAGDLVLASPYLAAGGIGASSRLTLGTTGNGSRYLRADASSFFFGSNGTSVDFNLDGTNLFQLITPSRNEKLNFNLGNGGTGFGATAISSQFGDGSARELALGGSRITFNTSARNFLVGPNFDAPASPQMIDVGADVGFSTRNVDGGTFDIVGAFGNDYKNIRAFAFKAQSDRGWKDAIRPVETSMLDEVMALTPSEYGVRGFDPETQRTRGLIAQDVQAAVPYAVSGEDGNLGVDTYVVLTTLVGAIQEQQQTINDLTERLAALENGA